MIPGPDTSGSEENKGTGPLGEIITDRSINIGEESFPRSIKMRLVARYVRWSQRGHISIARCLADFIDKNPEAVKVLGKVEPEEVQNEEAEKTDYVEKLQFLLDSHGLDWIIRTQEGNSRKMASIEILATGLNPSRYDTIGRFATGWNASDVARSLFNDWSTHPEALFVLQAGRGVWDLETKKIKESAIPNMS